VKSRHLIDRGDSVTAALSGGPDSVFLLHFLYKTANIMNLSLSAVHLNHKTRGEENDADEAFCRDLCKSLDIPLIVDSCPVPARASAEKKSLEEAGRSARIELYHKAVANRPRARVATGHNRDDQAETVLMRVISGASPQGLSGIRWVYRGFIIRPLLDTGKEEILNYLHREKIPYRQDSSNEDISFMRNRVRHQLLPLLKESFNPRVVEALSRLARTMSLEREYLEEMTGPDMARATASMKDPGAVDANVISEIHPWAAMTILRNTAITAGVDIGEMSLHHGLCLLDLINGPSGRSIQLPGGFKARREYDRIVISRHNPLPAIPAPVEITLPGRTELPGWGIAVTGTYMDPPDDLRIHKENEVFLDEDSAPPGVYVIRGRRPGDVFHPLGAPGKRKLKDFLIDRKIPRHRRDQIPLLVKDDEILWVAGLEISEKCRVGRNSRRVLKAEIEMLDK